MKKILILSGIMIFALTVYVLSFIAGVAIGKKETIEDVTTQLRECHHAPQPVVIGDSVYLIKCDSLVWMQMYP